MLQTYAETLKTRMQELLGSQIDPDRSQEAALLVDRSDIQEELVRLENHVEHFLGIARTTAAKSAKKLDFLLQEMNREANTLLSKTSGLAGEALQITEAGTGHEVGNRKGARTGAEHRMMRTSSSSRRRRVPANHAGE